MKRREVRLQTAVMANRPEHGAYMAGAIIDDTPPETVGDAERPRAIPTIAAYPEHHVPTEPTGEVLTERRGQWGEIIKWYPAGEPQPTARQAAEVAIGMATDLIHASMALETAKNEVVKQARSLHTEVEQLAKSWKTERTVTAQD